MEFEGACPPKQKCDRQPCLRKRGGVEKCMGLVQRKRDDNKNKICVFQGGGFGRGAERKIVQNAIFRGKRHDNKILKVKILLSRNLVVMEGLLGSSGGFGRKFPEGGLNFWCGNVHTKPSEAKF